jgi:hypothetical protein
MQRPPRWAASFYWRSGFCSIPDRRPHAPSACGTFPFADRTGSSKIVSLPSGAPLISRAAFPSFGMNGAVQFS